MKHFQKAITVAAAFAIFSVRTAHAECKLYLPVLETDRYSSLEKRNIADALAFRNIDLVNTEVEATHVFRVKLRIGYGRSLFSLNDQLRKFVQGNLFQADGRLLWLNQTGGEKIDPKNPSAFTLKSNVLLNWVNVSFRKSHVDCSDYADE